MKARRKVSQSILGSVPTMAVALGVGWLVAGTPAPSPIAWAQDQSAATTKDVIFARKIMMDSIGNNMDEIDTMLQSGRIDLIEGREHADMVSVLLMASRTCSHRALINGSQMSNAIPVPTPLRRRKCGRPTPISTSRQRTRRRRRTRRAGRPTTTSSRSSARNCGQPATPATRCI